MAWERDRTMNVKLRPCLTNKVGSAWSSWVHNCLCSPRSLANLLTVSLLSCGYSIVYVRMHTFKTGWLTPVPSHTNLSPSKCRLAIRKKKSFKEELEKALLGKGLKVKLRLAEVCWRLDW